MIAIILRSGLLGSFLVRGSVGPLGGLPIGLSTILRILGMALLRRFKESPNGFHLSSSLVFAIVMFPLG
jgi:hypothetical protein